MATDTDTKRAETQAKTQLECIREMVKAWEEADNGSDEQEEALEVMREDPLSVEVRSEWHCPGDDTEDGQYRILLCTGGPAVRIIGELGAYSEPDTADIQYQDWFTPWVSLPTDSEEEEAMLTYARCFYFGS